MSATAVDTIAGGHLATLRAHARRAAQWWLAELRATLPASLMLQVGGAARCSLVITVSDNDRITGRLSLPAGSVVFDWAASEFGLGAVMGALESQQLRRDEVVVLFACDPGQFLRRKMMIPKVALGALPEILSQDIGHRTPFDPDQIWHAGMQQGAEAGSDVVAVMHWIIRRDRAATELARCGLRPDDIDALTVTGGDAAPIIWLNDHQPEEQSWAGRTIRTLALAAAVVTLLGLAGILLVETVTAARIDDAIAELKQSDALLSEGNSAVRLHARKAAPGVVDVWAELSRLLPDDTFLTELRIVEGAVTVSGFSSNAPKLVRLIEQSPMFAAAHLTAAITPDTAERKDRFSLAFQLRGSRVRALSVAGTVRSER